jgi:hypothetical protein
MNTTSLESSPVLYALFPHGDHAKFLGGGEVSTLVLISICLGRSEQSVRVPVQYLVTR